MLSNVFFDLDGTLTDSQEGIIKCYRHALDKLDRPFPEEFGVDSYIGPPIRAVFKKLLCSNDEVLIEKAVAIYRERFSTVGLFENRVYPEIPELLSALHKNSLKLYIVTTKPKIYAERIIAHFQFSPWFSGTFGTELDGRFDNKTDLFEFILNNRRLGAAETVMIGDKKEDIIAGKTNHVKTIGVTYGYGTLQEIKDAAPDYICNSPQEMQKTIMRIP